MTATATASEAGARAHVTVRCGAATVGIDLAHVLEFRAALPTTRLPNHPDHVLGVANLRGAIIPVIDLGRRLGGGRTEATPVHVVVVVATGDRTVGLLVESVAAIVDLVPAGPPAGTVVGPDRDLPFGASATVDGASIPILDVAALVPATSLPAA